MSRVHPTLLIALAVGLFSGGCRSATPGLVRRPDPALLAPTFSEALERDRDSYVERRSKELVKDGKFADRDAARDLARYEWSQQHNTARVLSGEGFQSSSAPLRSPRRQRKDEQFKRDLANLDLSRP